MLYYEDALKADTVTVEKVTFPNKLISLAGNVYKPKAENLQREKYAAIIIGHPAGGVKEQTVGTYAVKLAEKGYLTLTFDAGYQGESGGMPRYLESPEERVEDFRCAVDYLMTRADVAAESIGILGMCAAGGYVIKAAGTDLRIKAVATISMADLGDLFRNGLERTMKKEGRQSLLAQIATQRTQEAQGEPMIYGGYVANSEEELAGKQNDYWEAYEYYRKSPAKHPNSPNKFIFSRMGSTMSFTALDRVEFLGTRPLLIIAGTKANTRYFAEETYEKYSGAKELYWVDGATHIELYWKKKYILSAVEKLADFYAKALEKDRSWSR
ncbi:MAG: alpha/beta hydrolase [Selenomonadaceae bacterium]|nr:alpha/beta hydrolase [Selenomonadaceae bacterium]